MGLKVRALLSFAVVLITMSFLGCGHYSCGATFGNATCTSSGGGISQGGGNNGLIAYGYFVDYPVRGPSAGMAEIELNQSAGTLNSNSSFTPPVLAPYPTGIVIVGKQYMYIPSYDGTLYGFSIDAATGTVTSVLANPMSVAGGNSIGASASGTMIFIGNTGTQQISAFTVNADGTLTPFAGNPYSTSGVTPAVMATDGQSKYLYVTAGVGSTQVAAFSIGGGSLASVTGSPFAFDVGQIAGESSGKYMFGVSGLANDNEIQVLAIGASGGLTAASTIVTTYTPRNIAVHPNGNWVYTLNQNPGSLTEFQPVEGFDFSGGTLSVMNGSPFTTLMANGGTIEQSGQFMFGLGQTLVAGNLESTVAAYAIDSTTGELSSWPAGQIQVTGFPGLDAAAFAATDAP